VDVTPDEPLGETGNDHLAESTRVGPAASTPTPQTRPDWASLLVSLLPFVDRYLKLQEGKQNHEQAIERVQAESGWRVLAIMMAFLAGVIAVMSWLTFAGKVSGDALLFLVGTVAGYMLAIVQRQLFPEIVEVNSDS
jgi:hypothetical protein